MKLIFIGHSFKYELEAVMKLFLPVESFGFETYGLPSGYIDKEGDRCVLSRSVYSGCAELSADCRLGGRTEKLSEKTPVSGKDYEHACELILCRLLFICMKKLTGTEPGWGMLTGVRPVKLVSRLLSGGMDADGVCRHMKERYFTSEEKTRLAVNTAKNQEKCLSELPKNGASLYVSIPFCPSRCAYCSFVSQTVESFKRLIPEYVERLCEEIELTGELLAGTGLKLDTVYFGGGTPTSLSAYDLDRIMKTAASAFDLSALREYTVEAGRPDTVTEEKLNAIYQNGCDRVSVNPQTVHDSVLKAIGRKHTAAQFYEAYALAKKTGFKAVNVDLIAGLPTDAPEGFSETVKRIIELEPENITVHTLSIKRAADMMREENRGGSAEDVKKMISFANGALEAAGYSPYYLYRQKNQLGNLENVGWERGGTAGIYNVNMMEEVQTVIAVGAGGSTKLVFGEGKIERYYNPKYPLDYLRLFDGSVISRKRTAFEEIRKKTEALRQ